MIGAVTHGFTTILFRGRKAGVGLRVERMVVSIFMTCPCLEDFQHLSLIRRGFFERAGGLRVAKRLVHARLVQRWGTGRPTYKDGFNSIPDNAVGLILALGELTEG